jgi:hypothetical protein
VYVSPGIVVVVYQPTPVENTGIELFVGFQTLVLLFPAILEVGSLKKSNVPEDMLLAFNDVNEAPEPLNEVALADELTVSVPLTVVFPDELILNLDVFESSSIIENKPVSDAPKIKTPSSVIFKPPVSVPPDCMIIP